MSQKTFRLNENVLKEYNRAFKQINEFKKMKHKKLFEEMFFVWLSSQYDKILDVAFSQQYEFKYECRNLNEINIARAFFKKNKSGNGISICYDKQLFNQKENFVFICRDEDTKNLYPQFKTEYSKKLDENLSEKLNKHFKTDAIKEKAKKEGVPLKEFYKNIAMSLLKETNSSQEEIHNLANNLKNITSISVGNALELFSKLDINVFDDDNFIDDLKNIIKIDCLQKLNDMFIELKKNPNEEMPTNALTSSLNRISEKIANADYETRSNLIKKLAEFTLKL